VATRAKDCYFRPRMRKCYTLGDRMRFSGLSIRQLEAFDMIMKAGSASAAAEAMHVSQPSVSRLLRVAGEIKEPNRGVLRLGAVAALSLDVIPAAMRRFQADHPKSVSTVSVRSSAEMVSAVASQLMDVAIDDAGVAFLDTIAVAEHSWNNVCVMSEDHPLVGQREVGSTIGPPPVPW
jgi:DNA-binding transcriptional LysR family regulator